MTDAAWTPAYRRFFLFVAMLSGLLGIALLAPALLALAVALVALLVLCHRESGTSLHALRLGREMGTSAMEGDVTRVPLVIENHGTRPALLVEIGDAFGPSLAERKRLLEPGPLGPRRRRRLFYRGECTRGWGVYTLGPLTLSAADSLGLYVTRVPLVHLEPFPVFPRLHDVPGVERTGARHTPAPQDWTAARSGQAAHYLGVREYRPGDDVRHVHWPATARRGSPVVKEFETDLLPYFTLFVDLQKAQRAGTGRKSTREYVVRTAATLLHAAVRRSHLVQVVGDPQEPLRLPPGQGADHLAHCLHALMQARLDGVVPFLDMVIREAGLIPPGSTAVLLSGTARLDPLRLADALSALQSRGVHVLLVLVDRDSFLAIDRAAPPPPERQRAVDEALAAAAAYGVPTAVLHEGEELDDRLAAGLFTGP